MNANNELDKALQVLESSGDFKILRRLDIDKDPRLSGSRVPERAKIGLCLDTETTGFRFPDDKIIEVGLVAFEYDMVSCEITRVIDRYSAFEDPETPLTPEVIKVTGITDEMLKGKRFDDDMVNALVKRADLVIAHNAAFDRPFIERRFPAFESLPWACSLSQIDWAGEFITSRPLEYLLFKCGGYFIDAHRALNDAEGLLGLLVEDLPDSGVPVFKTLLAAARQTTSRIQAVGAPFESKDTLKQRNYRWNDGTNGKPKCWWKDLPTEQESEELAFLGEFVYGGNTSSVVISRINAYSRFSGRE
ncbi:DNA polymerase III subunit epsilon (plasmid) [Geobacter anodireducens]|nr:DNA polymerase III subunit epsilon [Geobacter anodireducens]